MHEHHQKTPLANSKEDLNHSEGMAPTISSDHFTDYANQLQIWFDLPTVKEQRRFLESHCHLLDEHSDTILHDLFLQKPEGSAPTQKRHETFMLLQDARRRGGTEKAIREAYVNLHGGFALDLPSWLEAVEQRLTELLNQNRPQETAEARVVLLQETLELVQEDATCSPALLATLRRELAEAWQKHRRTDHAQALEMAIGLCNKILFVYTMTHYPYQYAKTQACLGMIYLERIAGERNENLERAIAYYREALHVHTLDAFPADYAKIHRGLGIAYQNRITGERHENLEQAIACYHEALRVHTLGAFPADYALVQNCMGTTYWYRIAGERRENLEQAIACFFEVSRVWTLAVSPFYYAIVQNNLGLVYNDRIAGERRENLERAIACYHEALRVHTLDAFPADYALTQNNLGLAYQNRIAGERRENLELAIACYHEALRVQDAFPAQYGLVPLNMGGTYNDRIVGERRENLEQAIVCLHKALNVLTLQAFPVYYAEAQNNLGKAYLQRITGERRENLELAIVCFYEALRVYTMEAFPHEFRNVNLNIAETEAQRENWNTVKDSYTTALKAEDLLVILGTGTLGRDAILKDGRDAAIRLGYALHRLGRISETAIAVERGRARGIAEAMTLDTADPALIIDEGRRSRYTSVRARLIIAQADLHTPLEDLDESTRRRLDLERTATYRQAKTAFDALVTEIRAAHDPDDFLDTPIDAATILRATSRIGSGHALVYLVATPWGGVAIAAIGEQESSSPRFASLDLPDLTEAFINTLVETYLEDHSEKLLGGVALAQMGEGFAQICQQWEGETFQAKAKSLHAACCAAQQDSTLDKAAQITMDCSPCRFLTKQPLAHLDQNDYTLLAATFNTFFLQQELARCQQQLGANVIHPVITWIQRQGATSLTFIPCGNLAAFPLAAVLLPDRRSVGETLPTSVAPSARSLLQTTTTRSPQAGMTTLGDPQNNLPWSEAEALTLTVLARRAALPAEVYLKQQATRDHLLTALGSRWVVNACCHGTFDQQEFLQSALRLAHGECITMAEMLNHHADLRGLRLLLLSACQTALLDLQGARNEGHSLATAMIQAGAQAVLATQWAVDDKATYLLMVRFVQEWLPQMEHEPPATALARAQAWLRHVTNEELAYWQSTLPMPLEQLDTTRSSEQSRIHSWQRIPVRGRLARWKDDEAQLIIRYEAQYEEPSAQPYADPYYWAGFQVIGW